MDEIPLAVKQLVDLDLVSDLRVYGPAIEDVAQFRQIWQTRFNEACVSDNLAMERIARRILDLIDASEAPEIFTYLTTNAEPRVMILYEAKTKKALRV